MAEDMPSHTGVLPAPIDRRFRRQSGFGAEVMQQPVGVERQQIRRVPAHGGFERAVEQGDIGQVKWLHLAGNGWGDFVNTGHGRSQIRVRRGPGGAGEERQQEAADGEKCCFFHRVARKAFETYPVHKCRPSRNGKVGG